MAISSALTQVWDGLLYTCMLLATIKRLKTQQLLKKSILRCWYRAERKPAHAILVRTSLNNKLPLCFVWSNRSSVLYAPFLHKGLYLLLKKAWRHNWGKLYFDIAQSASFLVQFQWALHSTTSCASRQALVCVSYDAHTFPSQWCQQTFASSSVICRISSSTFAILRCPAFSMLHKQTRGKIISDLEEGKQSHILTTSGRLVGLKIMRRFERRVHLGNTSTAFARGARDTQQMSFQGPTFKTISVTHNFRQCVKYEKSFCQKRWAICHSRFRRSLYAINTCLGSLCSSYNNREFVYKMIIVEELCFRNIWKICQPCFVWR